MGAILIVDDQDIVRAGIKKLLKELKLEFHPVLEAADGESALKTAMEHEPDILLVDIMMPGMNGMDLIEKLRKESIHSKIIVISAYSDFNYAQKAIRFKVDNYLLKPVTKKDLYQVVMAAKDALRQEQDGKKKTSEQELQYYYLLLKEYLIGKSLHIQTENLFKHTRLAALHSGWNTLTILDYPGSSPSARGRIKEQLDEKLTTADYLYLSFPDGEKRIIYILNTPIGEDSKPVAEIEAYIGPSAMNIYCGSSKPAEGLNSLQDSYLQAETSLKEGLFKERRISRYTEGRKSLGSIVKIKDCEEMLQLIRCGTPEELGQSLDNLFSRIFKERLDVESTKNVLHSVMNYLILNLSESNPEVLPDEEVLEHIQHAENMLKLKAVVKNAIDAMQSISRESKQTDHSNHIIQSVTEYIQKNYMLDISLAYIANKLNMNYYYVSNLFTKSTGMPISDYIRKIRLDKARELLVSSNAKIREVAEAVGFTSSKYFNRVFKKTFNLTAEHYREMHSKNRIE